MTPMLRTEVHDSIAWLTLDRPDKLNAMPRSFMAELRTAMDELALDAAVRVVVFTGAGRAFSVGGDIADFGSIGDTADRRAYMTEALAAYRAVDELPKPTIAAVHGHAAGGGCELTLVCDIVVCDTTAKFSMPETGVGLVPGPGAVRGPAQINQHWMRYMILTGLPLGAEEARLAGLVNTVVGEGEHTAEAGRLAGLIAARSPLAQAAGKAFLGRGGWENQSYAREMNALLQGAEDFQEGIAAFTSGRAPRF